jgi:hypothetical protein
MKHVLPVILFALLRPVFAEDAMLPMILAGHGGGTIAGRSQRACNLNLALAQRMGVRLEKFGDSVEALGGLA